MNNKFLDNFIPDRIRIIKEDKDPIHIYELLQKHFNISIDALKLDYQIGLDIIKIKVFIKGSEENIYELFKYFESRGVTKFELIEINQLIIDLDHFLKKIF